jgi:type VI secretion system secreted protein Hcp
MASDHLLEIEGIKGESKDSKHPNTIEIESYSWGASNDGSASHGSGAGAGKVHFQDVHFTAQVNAASAELMMSCANGKHFKKAQLFVRKQGENQQDYYIVTLEDFIVSSYQSGGSNGSSHLPTDQFALNFGKIKFEYKPQKDDGTLEAAKTAGWDLKQNKKYG